MKQYSPYQKTLLTEGFPESRIEDLYHGLDQLHRAISKLDTQTRERFWSVPIETRLRVFAEFENLADVTPTRPPRKEFVYYYDHGDGSPIRPGSPAFRQGLWYYRFRQEHAPGECAGCKDCLVEVELYKITTLPDDAQLGVMILVVNDEPHPADSVDSGPLSRTESRLSDPAREDEIAG